MLSVSDAGHYYCFKFLENCPIYFIWVGFIELSTFQDGYGSVVFYVFGGDFSWLCISSFGYCGYFLD